MAMKELTIEALELNPFTRIGKDWMLITAGDERAHNTMTAAWGGLGYLWNRNVATVFIRPQRYTKEFVDAGDRFTLSFFGPQYREALTLLGRTSGRDGDKIARAGLTPCFMDGTTAFEEADLILVCKKLYHQELLEDCFDDAAPSDQCYPNRDYHTMYIGEIERVLGQTEPARSK